MFKTTTEQLNALLRTLLIPHQLARPAQLTPSLSLLILQALFPDFPTVPSSLTQCPLDEGKLFLGILQSDVLCLFHDADQQGVSDVDPRRFASGKRKECAFIGEVLCWISRRVLRGGCGGSSTANTSYNLYETTTTTTMSMEPSELSLSNDLFDNEDVFTDNTHLSLGSNYNIPTSTPLVLSQAANQDSHLYAYVRYTGWIEPVDEVAEIRSFELSNSSTRRRTSLEKKFVPEIVSTPPHRRRVRSRDKSDESWDEFGLLRTPPPKNTSLHIPSTPDILSERKLALYNQCADILDTIFSTTENSLHSTSSH